MCDLSRILNSILSNLYPIAIESVSSDFFIVGPLGFRVDKELTRTKTYWSLIDVSFSIENLYRFASVY